MRKDELQFISDTIIMERLASDFTLTKKADLFGDIGFKSIASSIVEKVKGLLKGEKSWGKAILDMLVTGALFKLHWILGLAYAIAGAMGIDLIAIGKDLLSGVASKVSSGSITLSDVDIIAAGIPYHRMPKKRASLNKFAKQSRTELVRLMKGLLKGGRRNTLGRLIKAIFIYCFKSILIGAGLIAGVGLVGGLIGGLGKDEPETTPSKETPAPEAKPKAPEYKHKTKVFNTPGSVWFVPLVDGTVDNTLLAWAADIYPEQLSGYEDIIRSLPSFRDTVNILKRNYSARTPGSLLMPSEFKSRSQAVDRFAKDAFRRIQKEKL